MKMLLDDINLVAYRKYELMLCHGITHLSCDKHVYTIKPGFHYYNLYNNTYTQTDERYDNKYQVTILTLEKILTPATAQHEIWHTKTDKLFLPLDMKYYRKVENDNY